MQSVRAWLVMDYGADESDGRMAESEQFAQAKLNELLRAGSPTSDVPFAYLIVFSEHLLSRRHKSPAIRIG